MVKKKKKWLILHNEFHIKSGEEIFIEKFSALLSNHIDVDVLLIKKHYSLKNKIRFLFTQTINLLFVYKLARLIKKERYDVVNIHNQYPFLSNSLVVLRRFFPGVKFIHSIHNYRDFCANGLFFDGNRICFDCYERNAYYAIRKNCKNNKLISIAFALRLYLDNAIKHKWKYDHYFIMNNFQRELYHRKGLDNTILLPNFIPRNILKKKVKTIDFIFVGRINDPQKGFDTFFKICQIFPDYKFVAIGNYIENEKKILKNLEYTGKINQQKVQEYMSISKFLIATSKSYEVFPNILLEAWNNSVTPIVPNYPTYRSIIDNFGVIYNDSHDLIEKIKSNIEKPKQIDYSLALSKYSEDSIIETLEENNLL